MDLLLVFSVPNSSKLPKGYSETGHQRRCLIFVPLNWEIALSCNMLWEVYFSSILMCFSPLSLSPLSRFRKQQHGRRHYRGKFRIVLLLTCFSSSGIPVFVWFCVIISMCTNPKLFNSTKKYSQTHSSVALSDLPANGARLTPVSKQFRHKVAPEPWSTHRLLLQLQPREPMEWHFLR